MNINSFVPNEAYAALQDAGFNSLMTQHMRHPTVAILVKSCIWGGEMGKNMNENIKFCNLNPGFCGLPQKFSSGPKGLNECIDCPIQHTIDFRFCPTPYMFWNFQVIIRVFPYVTPQHILVSCCWCPISTCVVESIDVRECSQIHGLAHMNQIWTYVKSLSVDS